MQHLRSDCLVAAIEHVVRDIYLQHAAHTDLRQLHSEFSRTYNASDFDTATQDISMEARMLPLIGGGLAKYNVAHTKACVTLCRYPVADDRVSITYRVTIDR